MGYKLRFKSLIVNALCDLHTIAYQYDALARVIDAKYFSGQNTGGNPFRTYTYGFDVAGNRISETINGVTTNTSYNAANQVSTFTYNPNGNLTSYGTNTLHMGSCQPPVEYGCQHQPKQESVHRE